MKTGEGHSACLGSSPSPSATKYGEVTEWPKVHDWKSCGGPKALPRVRIPPSPPDLKMLVGKYLGDHLSRYT